MSKTFNLDEYDTIVINDLSLNGSFLTNFQVGVPIGTILPWQDINTIPDGWKLCDGNGTYTDISGITRQIPDLRSKFIIGHDTRDTSFNIDTSGSSFIHEDTDLNTNKPRSQMTLNDTNKDPTNDTTFRRIFYSLAYIIRVSNPNISTDAAGDKVINGDLTATGNLFVSNNIGIGTTSPSGQLHISSGTNGDCQLILEADTDNNNETDNPMILFRQDGGIDRAMIGTNENDLEIATSSDGNILFKTGGGTYSDAATGVRIDQNGNLGIGTTSPGYQLDIYKGSAGSDYYAARFNSEAVSGTGNTSTTYLRLERGTYGGAIGGYIKQGSGSGLIFSNIVGGNLSELMRIDHNGWVGIGTASPSYKLEVGGTGRFNGTLRVGGSTYNYVQFSNVSVADTDFNGNAVNSSYAQIQLRGLSYSIPGSHTGFLNGQQDWYIRADNIINHRLYFYYAATLTNNTRTSGNSGYINPGTSGVRMNFTGQHRSFVENVHISQYQDFEGLIVCANKNEYIDINKEVTRGKDAIQINESLPYVSLCKKEKDKSCFGVLSGSEDPDSREYAQGAFVSIGDKTKGDSRFFVNSVGEGAIWVSNKNGNLESGDYITTSSVPGYGQKQDSEFLANYSVAKITMDCDFQPTLQYKKKVLKRNVEISEVDASGNIHDVSGNILIFTQPTGDEVTDDSQKREAYSNPDYDFTVTGDYNITDVTENILNEHGEIQWEDTTEQEYAYEIRYVDPSGNIITKEQYDSTISNGGLAYIAAFVGCTYHCG